MTNTTFARLAATYDALTPAILAAWTARDDNALANLNARFDVYCTALGTTRDAFGDACLDRFSPPTP